MRQQISIVVTVENAVAAAFFPGLGIATSGGRVDTLTTGYSTSGGSYWTPTTSSFITSCGKSVVVALHCPHAIGKPFVPVNASLFCSIVYAVSCLLC